jgi:hypothetical protein
MTPPTGCVGHSTNAAISGVVRDAQLASVPGAMIIALRAQTGLAREIQAGATGYYTIPNLPIGDYRITIKIEPISLSFAVAPESLPTTNIYV